MKRVLLGAVLALIVAVVPSALGGRNPIEPPRVCDGLTICSPVAGPWVVVPGPEGGGMGRSLWQLGCPRGVVGGTDARFGDSWVDVTFAGHIGAPVNPGITTGHTVVFDAVSVGPNGRPSSFIPFVGCIPSEGGPRAPTAVGAPSRLRGQLRLGDPIVRRMRVLDLRRRRATTEFGCRQGERLVSSATAIGLYTAREPSLGQLRGVRVDRAIVGGKLVVTARRVGLPLAVPVEVQIHALCAGVA